MARFYRRWLKIGSGIAVSVTTIIGLFLLLQLNFGFQITDLTGDIVCSGTYDSPCISEFIVKNPTKYNVDIYSKDQVKLDFSPEIYDYALFVKDRRCSATGKCACELKDGRVLGFEDWRCVDFTNKTKPRSDKLYNFRFPSYSDTKFRLAGIKKNPKDVIKWGFGVNDSYLDPFWYAPNTQDVVFSSNVSVITMELGSRVNISANVSGYSGEVCVNINHPDYGNNYTCGNPNAEFLFNISYFRKTKLNNESGCYQEFTNVTSCGNLLGNSTATTSYLYPERMIDGDWNTYAQVGTMGNILKINSVYYVPNGATEYKWQYKLGSGISEFSNISIPYYCEHDGYLNLTLLATVKDISSYGYVNFTCDDTLIYRTVDDSPGADIYVYEEGITWERYPKYNLTYQNGGNQTIYIKAHQYDDIINFSINLTGFLVNGTYPSDVKLYVNDTFIKTVGPVIINENAELNEFNDSTTEKKHTVTRSPQTFTDYFSLPAQSTILSAYLNISGFNSSDPAETVYDDFEDDSINYSLWQNTSSGTGNPFNPIFNETDGYLYLECFYGWGSPYSWNCDQHKVESINLPDLNLITNLTLDLELDTQNSNTDSVNIYLRVFGTTIIQKVCTEFCSFNWNDRSVWQFNRNGNNFDVYNDGVWNKTITPSDNIIEISLRGTEAGNPSSGTSFSKLYYVNVTKTTQPTNPTLYIGVVDSTPEWTYDGVFVQENNKTNNFNDSINSFIFSCTTTFCDVPVYLTVEGGGFINLSDIDISYSSKPIITSINQSVVQNFLRNSTGFTTIPIKIETTKNGTLQINDVRFDYAGGNDTINVTVYPKDPQIKYDDSPRNQSFYSYKNLTAPTTITNELLNESETLGISDAEFYSEYELNLTDHYSANTPNLTIHKAIYQLSGAILYDIISGDSFYYNVSIYNYSSGQYVTKIEKNITSGDNVTRWYGAGTKTICLIEEYALDFSDSDFRNNGLVRIRYSGVSDLSHGGGLSNRECDGKNLGSGSDSGWANYYILNGTTAMNDTFSIINYYSKWDYLFPRFIDFFEIIPDTPTSKAVEPYGQTKNTPIFNITFENYGGRKANQFIYLNETMSCVDLYISQNSTKPSSSLWDGLVGYWPFDIDARDLSGFNNHGTISNAVFNISGGYIGGAYSSNGSEQYVSFGDKDEFSVDNTNEFTASFWMYCLPNSAGYTHPFGKGKSSSYEWYFRAGADCDYIRVVTNNNSGTVDSGVSYSADLSNKWTYVAATWDYSGTTMNMTLYVNGSFISDNSIVVDYANADAEMRVFDRYDSRNFNGTVDDIRVYNRSLNSSEISELYDRTKNKYYDAKLTTNWTAVQWNAEYLNNTRYWMWADYNCSYTNWHLFQPDIFFRTCATDVDVCSEDFI